MDELEKLLDMYERVTKELGWEGRYPAKIDRRYIDGEAVALVIDDGEYAAVRDNESGMWCIERLEHYPGDRETPPDDEPVVVYEDIGTVGGALSKLFQTIFDDALDDAFQSLAPEY